jgi:plastocyanin
MTVIRGQLSLTSGGRPLRPQEAVDAVVYFRSAQPMAVSPPTQPFVMTTERKTFSPRVLPIPVGASVRFPNNDPILHNVFSTAKEANFDLGLYGKGEGESHTFTQPGVIRVFCNVHHAMVAHVLVMDTPLFVKPDAQGRFRLANVPEGPGELFVWHERSQLWRRAYVAGKDGDVTVPLELSKRKIPPHLNKFGQPYRRTRPDEY